MARSFNKLTIIGYLGHDPEMKYTPTGQAVTTFSVAVNTRRQVDGQRQESTQWFRVSVWSRMAEVAAERLHKGSSVLVEGPLHVRDYVGRDGQPRVALDVTARELRMLDGPADGTPAQDDQALVREAGLPASSSALDALDEPPF
jgi:single-strand DNA-binding protein